MAAKMALRCNPSSSGRSVRTDITRWKRHMPPGVSSTSCTMGTASRMVRRTPASINGLRSSRTSPPATA